MDELEMMCCPKCGCTGTQVGEIMLDSDVAREVYRCDWCKIAWECEGEVSIDWTHRRRVEYVATDRLGPIDTDTKDVTLIIRGWGKPSDVYDDTEAG